MLRNFITITYRNFLRNLNYTFINTMGLGVGLASCLIIYLIVTFELRFDKFHSRFDRMYRVVHTSENASGKDHSGVTPYPFIAAFHNDFPDIPLATQFHYQHETQMTHDGEKLKMEQVIFADSLFFKVFDFGVVEGNPAKDLGGPGKAFLTESTAKKILKPGSSRTVKLDNKLTLDIVGIVKDPPPSSHIQYQMIVSMPSLNADFIGLPLTEWGMTMSGYSYLVLPEEMTQERVETRFLDFVKKYYTNSEDNNHQTYNLQPLGDIHFGQVYQSNPDDSQSMSEANLWVLALLGIFILVVACINFINLSTALAVKKSREIGVRKTLGASRPQLSRQFLMEAFIITLISSLIAVSIVELALPSLNAFLEKKLELDFTGDRWLAPFLGVLIITTSLLAGAYPALVLSRFNPVDVLKNKLTHVGSSGAYARKYLVMFQFLIAQVLIMGTLVVANQMNYFRSKPLGFIRNGIINVSIPDNKKELLTAFQSQLEAIPGVERTSLSLGAPTAENNFTTGFSLSDNEKETFDCTIKPVDWNYQATYGLELAAGRWFMESEERAIFGAESDRTAKYQYIVNEAAVKRMGFRTNEEAIGRKITTGVQRISAEIVGVVKDFHTASLHKQVGPTVLMQFPFFYYEAGIRFDAGKTADVLAAVEKAYNGLFPDYMFKYTFLDQHLESLYKQEQRSLALVRIFSGLSIFISCLGLLGLISFMTQQKMKEVGIRKVFGASVQSIVYLFSKGFAGLIGVSFILAAPLAWYVMNQWLQGFAYRTVIGWDVFVIAIVSTAAIALATVSYQSIRAALANPVNSLRNE